MDKKLIQILVVTALATAAFLLVAQTVFGTATTTSVTSSATVTTTAPIVSFVSGPNGGTAISLNANTTTPISVAVTVTDYNGCTDFNNSTETIALFRGDIASSSCLTSSTPNPLFCYVASAFSTSTCPGGFTANATTTFSMYYFASPTDNASYTYNGKGWQGAITVTNPAKLSVSTTSATTTLNSLEAISSTPSSIAYGTLAPAQVNSPSVTTTISDVGNTSTTFQFSATQSLTGGVPTTTLVTSSQQYATSSGFTYGTGYALSSTPVTLNGVSIAAPISTTTVSTNIFWLLQVPTGTPTGTYNGTNLFTGQSVN
ncbi:MAG: hypothetical protein ABSE18_01980 [Minisyncoccia bacterium]|jgi:hypothetical protein